MNPLWTRSWLECRPRFMMSGLLTAVLALNAVVMMAEGEIAGQLDYWEAMSFILFGVLLPTSALLLAGAGINIQSNSGFTQGLHPSTSFLLSLPATRAQLLFTRAATGGILLLLWILVSFPLLLAIASFLNKPLPPEPLRLLPFLLLAALFYYSLWVLIAARFDEIWSSTIAMTIVGLIAGYSMAGGPGWFNMIAFMKGENGAQQLPQSLFCLAASALFFRLSLTILRRREF